MLRVGINGMGRVGRAILRLCMQKDLYSDLHVVHVNGGADAATTAHLLKYDSVHGRFPQNIEVENHGSRLRIGDTYFSYSSERDPSVLCWGDLGVDFVIEATGAFNSFSKSSVHLENGADHVLITAPAANADATIVYGVNHGLLDGTQKIISGASCTTNCLSVVLDVLRKSVGVKKGRMTTVHAYTNDQPTLDSNHKDLYRSRAAAMSIIPTTTGATKAVDLIFPDMKGKLDGTAVRVPVPNVSMVDLVFMTEVPEVSVDRINTLFKDGCNGYMKGIIDYITDPCVSVDFNHSDCTASIASDQTQVTGGDLVRVLAWYDNEWGFSNRMCDIAMHIGRVIGKIS